MKHNKGFSLLKSMFGLGPSVVNNVDDHLRQSLVDLVSDRAWHAAGPKEEQTTEREEENLFLDC
jgi:hypothetical protein